MSLGWNRFNRVRHRENFKNLREGRWRRRADIGTHYDKVVACGCFAKNNSATAPRLTAANIPKAIV